MPARFAATTDKVLGLLALAGVVFVAWAMVSDSTTSLHVYGGLGFVLAVSASFGIRSYGGGGEPAPQMTAAGLKAVVADRAIPFSVCTKCRVVIDLPRAFSCPECGLTDTCVRVAEESERSFAMAAIGSDR